MTPKWFVQFLILIGVGLLLSLPAVAQDQPVWQMSAGFAYNQYAPSGTLPIQAFGEMDRQASGPFYITFGYDITATPRLSLDGKFQLPTLQFTPRVGSKYYLPLGSNLFFRAYLLGDAGIAFSTSQALGSFTGGAGLNIPIKKDSHWEGLGEFRAIARTTLSTSFIMQFGIQYHP